MCDVCVNEIMSMCVNEIMSMRVWISHKQQPWCVSWEEKVRVYQEYPQTPPIRTGRIAYHHHHDDTQTLKSIHKHIYTYFDIFILQGFHVESNGRYGLYRFVTFVLQSIQNGGLTGIVQSQNQYPYLLGTEQAFEYFTK